MSRRRARVTAAVVAPAVVLALVVAGCGGSGGGKEAPSAQGGSPFAQVRWDEVDYPLGCGGAATVAGRVVEVAVSGRSQPLAVVMASCNSGHLFANLFAFEPGSDAAQPHLVQQLTPDAFSEQPISLFASKDTVVLKSAGFTEEGTCCPTDDRIHRWDWDGSRFRARDSVPIRSIVVPDVVGMPFDEAGGVLVRHGILIFDWQQLGNPSKPESRLRVVKVDPAPGSVIHPPHFRVTVSTR